MANEKILVVDDDKNICELLRLYLVKEGYNVTMAHDGAAALAEFDKLHPDLVLLDVMMPVMDGWEVCRKIRAKDNTPIIMLTAKGETYDKVLGLELGADDYIVKLRAKSSRPRPRSWNCWPAWRATPTACTPATSCWTRCGALSITVTPAPSTSMSSVCARSWKVRPSSGV